MNKKNLEDLILIQNRYRNLINQLNNLSNQSELLKKCLISMSENLLFLNNKDFYNNLNIGYDVLIDELNLIKKKFSKLPSNISFKVLKNTSSLDLSYKICEINMLLLKYMNHITPTNLELVFELFIGTNKFTSSISKNDKLLLKLLNSVFRPTNIWDSFNHKKEVPYLVKEKKEKKNMTKDMIETLFEKNDSVSSIIIGEASLPHFLKNLTEIVISDNKKNERTIKYDQMEILALFNNYRDNIKITKNNNINTLYEEKNGLSMFIRLNERILVVQGVLNDDILDVNKNNEYIAELLKKIKQHLNYEVITVPKGFKSRFIETLLIRDILTSSVEEIATLRQSLNVIDIKGSSAQFIAHLQIKLDQELNQAKQVLEQEKLNKLEGIKEIENPTSKSTRTKKKL